MKTTIRARFHAVVRPAFWFWLAMLQYGPTVAEWGEGRLIDLAMRHVIAFAAVCMGISSLRSNADLTGNQKPGERGGIMNEAKPASDCTGPSDCSADCFGYEQDRHGWVVYAQPTRGEYIIIAGPFATDDEARAYFEQNSLLDRSRLPNTAKEVE